MYKNAGKPKEYGENKPKKRKYIGTICPECEKGKMRSVEESFQRAGVTISHKVYECPECGYSEEYVNKRDHKKIDFE